ncbi:hypothetical protein [Oscillibacter sp.]|uniref:hypothetical protein n=1 Tax=Oscillibacter sp. TaxID=1945593 RepID=UPI002D800BFA|nr:hypothetical protein [Oscillibacter sp.]
MSEVKVEALLAAIQDGKPWLDRFTGKEYDKAYQEYRAKYAPLFREAALADGEEGVEALAEVLLDGLAEGWRRQKPWNRSLAQMNDKQVIVCYLAPVLTEDPVCAPLEEKLREGWAARWPKEAYKTPSLAKIRKGFRPTFLGIALPFGDKEDDE